MELEGSLKSFNLLEILQFLSIGKLTGGLVLKNKQREIVLYIKSGKVVYSDQMKISERLCRACIDKGIIRRTELTNILLEDDSEKEFYNLIESLTESNQLDLLLLEDMIHLFIEDMVWEILLWENGDFRFNHQEVEFNPMIKVHVDIEALCIEGSRRFEDCKKFLTLIPNRECVPVLKPIKSGKIDMVRDMTYEWGVLSLINGYRNVDSIIERSGSGVFETYRILASLVDMGAIEMLPSEAVFQKYIKKVEQYTKDQPVSIVAEADNGGGVAGVTGKFLQAFKGKVNGMSGQTAVSSLCLIAELYNAYQKALASKNAFNKDELIPFTLWEKVVNEYPRIDLIYWYNNRLQIERFERYINFINDENYTGSCVKEADIALIKGIKNLYQYGVDQIGEKQAVKLLQNAVQEVADKHTTPDLNLDNVIQNIIHG